MDDKILKSKDSLKVIDWSDKKLQDMVDTKKSLPGITLSTLGMDKNYSSSYVDNRLINVFELFNGVGVFDGETSSNKRHRLHELESFIFDRVSEVKFKRMLAKKKRNVIIFKEVTSKILSMENIKESAFDLFVEHGSFNLFYSCLVEFLKGDDVVDNKKLRFSIINLISKSVEINEVKGASISFSIDTISNSIVLNLVKKPISRDYMVNLNLKFKPNGSVSFMCYDSDDSDKSYITGSVSRYDTYLSSIKFKTIIDMLNSGA
jgi:hypothetical protein